MASPIRQAMRQSVFLRTMLQRHREELVGREPVGLRTISKVVRGTDQRGFKYVPIQLIVAISDSGNIQRVEGWQEPDQPFQVFVAKADLVPAKIAQEFERHRKGASPLNIKSTWKYGLWSMEAQEVAGVAAFLAARHEDRSDASSGPLNQTTRKQQIRAPSRAQSTRAKNTVEAACKYCGARDLTARSGKYGYHWRCGSCGKNTKMLEVCSKCGAEGEGSMGYGFAKRGRTTSATARHAELPKEYGSKGKQPLSATGPCRHRGTWRCQSNA